MRKLVFFIVLLHAVKPCFSSDINGWDSILVMKKSPFFTDLMAKKSQIQPLRSPEFPFVSPKHPFLKERRYQFFTLSGELYIHFTGSGLLYKLKNASDSSFIFNRLDDTENLNYNFEAFLFTHQKEIYNIGGYGFWRSSGTLRKYNPKDFEWDAVPLNEEIHIPFLNQIGTAGLFSWYNSEKGHLYIPFQTVINGGIKNKSEKDLNDTHVYKLNLATHEWKKLGKTNPDFYNILLKTKWVLPTDKGQLISFDNKIYSVDFENNTISESNDAGFAQSLSRINIDFLAYYDKETIYYLNGRTWKYDSVKVPLTKFEKSNFKVWKKNKAGFFIGIAPILIILAATAARKRRAKKAQDAIYSATSDTIVVNSSPSKVAHTSSIKIRFTETEKQLLQLLLEKSQQNSTTNIAEINYVLGIKDKNQGLQKKVRSEVINSINEKFSFLQDESTLLIGNIRSQADKRYFEYYIEHQHLLLLENLLKEQE